MLCLWRCIGAVVEGHDSGSAVLLAHSDSRYLALVTEFCHSDVLLTEFCHSDVLVTEFCHFYVF